MINRLKGNQKGMTLIELVVATAIVGLLTSAFSAITFDFFHHTARSNAHMTASSGMDSAARWISNDGQMAQNTDLTPGAEAVSSLNLSWTDPVNGDTYEIDYFLSGEELIRQESINSVVQSTKIVARYVTDIGFYQPADTEQLFTVTLTSSGGGTTVTVSETREYHVTLRAQD